MSRKAAVYYNKVLAGSLEKTANGTYQAQNLFPFFFGLLSEGVNKQTQCRLLKIDENDHFSLLLKTAGADTIGAIIIKPLDE